MRSRLGAIVLDCNDLKRATSFWSGALGYDVDSASDSWVGLTDPKRKGVDLGLQPTSDAKAGVNRVHLDLWTDDVAGEVARLEKLGARRASWPYYVPGAKYVVMLDTEGNEFCVCPA